MEEYCWAITLIVRRSCCGRSGSVVFQPDFFLQYIIDHTWTQFRLAHGPICAQFDLRSLICAQFDSRWNLRNASTALWLGVCVRFCLLYRDICVLVGPDVVENRVKSEKKFLTRHPTVYLHTDRWNHVRANTRVRKFALRRVVYVCQSRSSHSFHINEILVVAEPNVFVNALSFLACLCVNLMGRFENDPVFPFHLSFSMFYQLVRT